jgi:hypothetical protein
MSPKCLPFLALSLLLSGPVPLQADNTRPAAQLIPPDALVVVSLAQPKELVDLALSDPVAGAITKLPPVAKAMTQPGFQQSQRLVQYLEGKLGSDWRTLVHKLLGGEVSVALLPQKAYLLVLDVADARLLQEMHQVAVQIAEAQAMNQGRPSALTAGEVQGVKIWTASKGHLAYAITDRRLVAGASPELVAAALNRKPDDSLAALPAYRAAGDAVGQTTGTAWLNLARLRKLGVGGGKGLEGVQPMAQLLAGGAVEAVRDAQWIAARLRVAGAQLSLEAVFDIQPEAQAALSAYAWPVEANRGAAQNLTLPHQIAAASLYRDLQAFYRNKEKLFPERSGGLVFFENMMGIFFSGRDLADEVLAEAEPQLRLVAAEQQYGAAKPALQIPAFAVVFRVRHPEQFGEVMEAAWQKAIGLVNITRGQKAQPGLIIDRPIHHGTQFSMAYFPTMPGEGQQQAALRYNFRPALVRMGNHYVLSSTDGLARELIDALKAEGVRPPPAVAGASTLVDVDLAAVAAVLAANRSVLVRQTMLDKAVAQEAAEGRIDMLLGLVQRLDHATFTLRRTPGQIRAALTVKLK